MFRYRKIDYGSCVSASLKLIRHTQLLIDVYHKKTVFLVENKSCVILNGLHTVCIHL